MARQDITARIISHTSPADQIYLLDIKAPEIAAQARPGQFCMLHPLNNPDTHDPLLRRPLSIHDARDDGTVCFLYRKTGKGTELLSMLKAGESIRILGPLGNGFTWRQDSACILVGGGMGIAPLLFLSKRLKHSGSTFCVILGAATAHDLACIESFRAISPKDSLFFTTEDGSMGKQGLVTDILKEFLDRSHGNGNGLRVMTCGPWPMMKAVASMCSRNRIACQVSLEAHMACGTGLCLGCAVPTAGDKAGYIHVCREGPVTDAENIRW